MEPVSATVVAIIAVCSAVIPLLAKDVILPMWNAWLNKAKAAEKLDARAEKLQAKAEKLRNGKDLK